MTSGGRLLRLSDPTGSNPPGVAYCASEGDK
jgi:hypothetical protein